ncbi:MAG: tetratricopeptide repeat protein [Bacillota bacterium]|nr:tetratricopeptide repeat protein [Bacillota bacterium]
MKVDKNKVILFLGIIICAVGIYFAVSTSNKYKEEQKSLSQKYDQQLKDAEEAKKKEEDAAKEKQEEQKQIEDKKRALDDKCTEGEKQFASGDYKAAIATADEVLKEDTQNIKALTIKGISLCYTRKLSGLDEIQKALDIKPDYGYALYNKALSYDKFWRYDEALAYYEKALQSDGGTEVKALSDYGIAVISARKEDMANAEKYLKEAVQLDRELAQRAAKEPLLSKIKLN